MVRKFVSLLVSVWYFENEFTPVHWLGTTLVFGGTFVFSEVHRKTAKRSRSIIPTEEEILPALEPILAAEPIPKIPVKLSKSQNRHNQKSK